MLVGGEKGIVEILLCISCNVLPFVSGTTKYAKNTDTAVKHENVQKVAAWPILSSMVGNSLVTANTKHQCTTIDRLLATPLVSGGNISLITVNGTDP
ncbi:hypothetical protein DBV15_07488 [Temnothorax longispinosus]|uniref:Uncharacterized protein n=1 Tax=Temnothorax longispinosus TaxID=300112 RepID=A0A4S2KEH8_9HYME|nr:hypothetical protein DBV15_07488 [Temnothorax longispinosus]